MMNVIGGYSMLLKGNIEKLASETVPMLLQQHYNLQQTPRFMTESYNTLTYRMNEWTFNVQCKTLEEELYEVML